ncbi:hypothetical protein B0I27_103285 [Arcticibacter pallidicorallinus]|uniref:MG2 domain-containing protein n=2 Tax=Arcticibacter pallidicorallinus TaxID=1259464 RepID=A0A2T0U7G0_9SPHI|nr:hypothetical protein B0I27_103285 [Arcticibacter pallidicorallinus]
MLQPFIGLTQMAAFDSINASFDRYRQSHVQEKIFAHIDRTSYLAGEILWFKIYNVDASYHRPLELSSVAYVEVLNAQSKAVVQAKIALNKGKGNGSLYLPVSLTSGNYSFRVYTRWMRNFSPDFFFEERIRVINTLTAQPDMVRANEKHYDVQFFPEGGDLLSGVESKVGFRAIDESGKGVNIKGNIQDDAGRIVSEMISGRFGIGNFMLTPVPGTGYKAVVQFSDGRKATYRLPAAKSDGYRLALTESDDEVFVHVASNRRDMAEMYLFVHASNRVEVASKVRLNEGQAQISIPKTKLHNGISHFTLFNSGYKPVSERLWFKRSPKELTVEASTDNQEYDRRKKVLVDVRSSITGSVPAAANLSIAIYNADSLQHSVHGGIDSYFLLRSELKGTIEQPEYYFSGDKEVSQAIDNLMLTHGWRRFNWDQVFSQQPFKAEYIPETSYHIVPARVTSSVTNRPVSGIRSYLSVPGRFIRYYNGTSNSDGRVDFYTRGLNGVQPLVLQTSNADTALYNVDLTDVFSDKYSAKFSSPVSLTSLPKKTLLINSINMQAHNIFLREQLNRFGESIIDTVPFYGHLEEKYLLDNYTRFPTVEEVLREYVLGVGVRRRNGKPMMQVFSGDVNKGFFEEPPLVLMDGVPMFDQLKFFSYDPLKIKSVEVLSKRYFYGPDVYGGLILFNTYKGNLDGMELDPDASIIDYDGLQQVREFYAPRYDSPDQLNSRLPDFRNLLLWNPDVETGRDGKTQLSFYTSDRPGSYRGVIQGLTEQGQAGTYSFEFKVR